MSDNLIQEAKLPNQAILDWKAKGNKVLGTVCCYVPEELLDAAGITAYRLRATGCAEDSQGKAWMSPYSCSYTRACLELTLNGTYSFLDGIISSDGCLQAQRLYDNWRYNDKEKFRHLVTVPRLYSEEGFNWYRNELVTLKEAIEAFSGTKIADDALEKSIEKYNETRRLLQELYDLQAQNPPRITGADVLSIVLAAMSMPKDQFNAELKEYLIVNKAKNSQSLVKSGCRLMVVGSGIDNPDYIKLIEDKGANVVTDVQCFGSRYLWEPVEIEGDILTSLAKSYLARPTCPRMMDSYPALFDLMASMAKKFKVDGVVYVTMRNCDLWGGGQLIFDDRFKAAKLPVLHLEREEITANEGQIGLRVEAFIETL
jgi:bzd-type benzoyl-CoA reductase N subunit